jgi:hypothetical protein
MSEICAEISMALYYIEIDFGQRSLRVPSTECVNHVVLLLGHLQLIMLSRSDNTLDLFETSVWRKVE